MNEDDVIEFTYKHPTQKPSYIGESYDIESYDIYLNGNSFASSGKTSTFVMNQYTPDKVSLYFENSDSKSKPRPQRRKWYDIFRKG